MKVAIEILESELRKLDKKVNRLSRKIEYNQKELEFYNGENFQGFKDYAEKTYNDFQKRFLQDATSSRISCLSYELVADKHSLDYLKNRINEIKSAIKILEGKSD